MGWTAPHSFVPLEVPTAAQWNAWVSDNLAWLAEERPRARVYSNVDISTANGVVEALVFTHVRSQVGAVWDAGAPTRLTVPAGGSGEYLIGGGISWDNNVTGSRKLEIVVNGTTVAVSDERSATADNPRNHVTTLYGLNAGDYVEAFVTQSSGGALDVLTLPNFSPEFWMIWQGY